MDLIDRERAINKLEDLIIARRGWLTDGSAEIRGIDAAICELVALPSAEKTGEWIDTIEHDGWSCSNCGGSITSRYGKYSYCPCCGARMVGD